MKASQIQNRLCLLFAFTCTPLIASAALLSAEGPPLLEAPFTQDEASKAKSKSSKHLGLEAEVTNSVQMKFTLIPPGQFKMGAKADETEWSELKEPQHKVRITKPFYMGVCEVTQDQFEQIMGRNPSAFSHRGLNLLIVAKLEVGRFPVDRVTWETASEFCKRLSELPDEKIRRTRLSIANGS